MILQVKIYLIKPNRICDPTATGNNRSNQTKQNNICEPTGNNRSNHTKPNNICDPTGKNISNQTEPYL